MNVKPRFLATAIGSLPLNDPVRAVDLVLASIPEAPIWPQLPAAGNERTDGDAVFGGNALRGH